MLCEKDKEDRRRRSWSELVLPPSRVRYKCSVLLILAFYVFILMMRPGVGGGGGVLWYLGFGI